MLAKNSARTSNLVQGGYCFFFLFVSCDGRSLGGAAGCGLRGSSFGSDFWCHVKINGSRRLLGFGFLDSALASLRVSRHSPPLLHRGWLAAPRLLSSTGLFLFCVGLQAMSRSGPNLQARIRLNPARGLPTRGAISQQTSPLPSVTVSYPSPIQDPVAPPKRVVVGRMAALRLRLLSYLTPASKNQVEPSSGCRQGGAYHKKPRHCPLSLSPIRHPPKTPLLHQNESSSNVRQRYGSVFFRA